jgi:hypothetical protein
MKTPRSTFHLNGKFGGVLVRLVGTRKGISCRWSGSKDERRWGIAFDQSTNVRDGVSDDRTRCFDSSRSRIEADGF